MDNTVIAAIITGGASIIASLITFWAARPKQNEPDASEKAKKKTLYLSQTFWAVLVLVSSFILILTLRSSEPVTRLVAFAIACDVASIVIGVISFTLVRALDRFK